MKRFFFSPPPPSLPPPDFGYRTLGRFQNLEIDASAEHAACPENARAAKVTEATLTKALLELKARGGVNALRR